MVQLFFPSNLSGCVNDTDCLSGRCSLIVDDQRWCSCPRFYDPIDNCHSYYYDKLSIISPIVFLLVVLLVSAALISPLLPYLRYELRRWYRSKIPRSKLLVVAVVTPDRMEQSCHSKEIILENSIDLHLSDDFFRMTTLHPHGGSSLGVDF